MACWRRDSSESTPFLAMRKRIILAPIPIMFILESDNLVESEGSIHENIRPQISFATLGLWVFLMAFSPQKVKKMLTFLPVAAAPLASTKVARALSRSSLKSMNVLPWAFATGCVASAARATLFSISTMCMPDSECLLINRLPVVRHHASASRGKPASVAFTISLCPASSFSMACFIFMIGPGHCMPQASTFIVVLS